MPSVHMTNAALTGQQYSLLPSNLIPGLILCALLTGPQPQPHNTETEYIVSELKCGEKHQLLHC